MAKVTSNKTVKPQPVPAGVDPLTALVGDAISAADKAIIETVLSDERFANLRTHLETAENFAQKGLGSLREAVQEVRHLLIDVKVSVVDVRDFLKVAGLHNVRVSEFLTIAQSTQADFDAFMRREVSFSVALETARLVTMTEDDARELEMEIISGESGSGGGNATPGAKKSSKKKTPGKRGAKPKKPIEKVQAAMLKLVALAQRLKVDHCTVTPGDYQVILSCKK